MIVTRYKPVGHTKTDERGTPDRNEFYALSRDDMLSETNSPSHPKVFTLNHSLLHRFSASAHAIVVTMFSHLDTHLSLPPGTLSSHHRLETTSGSQARMLKYMSQPIVDRKVSMPAHTDFGSLTIVFSELGGLQILPQPKDSSPVQEWSYVRPVPGHAVINVGDALAKFTNGLLRSNIHRVTSAPGAQAELVRYSVAYFERPGDDVVLKRLNGGNIIPSLGDKEVEEELTSKQWIAKKLLAMRVSEKKQDTMV